MNCNKILKLLPLYISDDLDESELSTIEVHLGTCLNCYREYQTHLRSLRALKQLGEKPDLSTILVDFSDEVMQRVARDPKGPAAPVPKVVYPFIPRTVAAAAMVIAVLAAFYFFTGNEEPPGSGSPGIQNPTHTVNMGTPGNESSLQPLNPEEKARRLDTLKPLHFPTNVQPVNFRDF